MQVTTVVVSPLVNRIPRFLPQPPAASYWADEDHPEGASPRTSPESHLSEQVVVARGVQPNDERRSQAEEGEHRQQGNENQGVKTERKQMAKNCVNHRLFPSIWNCGAVGILA